MKTIHVKPTESDLWISGQLLRIEVYRTSFSVFSQIEQPVVVEAALEVQETVYPIHVLPQFFAVNGTLELPAYCLRPTLEEKRKRLFSNPTLKQQRELREKLAEGVGSGQVESLPDTGLESVATKTNIGDNVTVGVIDEPNDSVALGT